MVPYMVHKNIPKNSKYPVNFGVYGQVWEMYCLRDIFITSFSNIRVKKSIANDFAQIWAFFFEIFH